MRLITTLWILGMMANLTRQLPGEGSALKDAADFGNFLENTVDGTPSPVLNDDEYLSPHAWENSGKFEGDMVLSDRQRKLLVEKVVEGISRNGLRDITKRWPDNVVVFDIDTDDFGPEYVEGIKRGMNDIESNSCIRFRQRSGNDNDFVRIQGKRAGCFSKVGYVGGEQILNLQPRRPGLGCFRHGTVVHEMLHTLGFFHMQSHDKRDRYVRILWENIVPGAQQNFRKYSSDLITDFGVPYDYSSVLHYSDKAFSKNGGSTIIPKDSSASIGQRIGMSQSDIDKLNAMYNCNQNSDSNNNLKTKSPGTTPKDIKSIVGKVLPNTKNSTATTRDLQREFYNSFFDSPFLFRHSLKSQNQKLSSPPRDTLESIENDSEEQFDHNFDHPLESAFEFDWFLKRK